TELGRRVPARIHAHHERRRRNAQARRAAGMAVLWRALELVVAVGRAGDELELCVRRAALVAHAHVDPARPLEAQLELGAARPYAARACGRPAVLGIDGLEVVDAAGSGGELEASLRVHLDGAEGLCGTRALVAGEQPTR